MSFVDFQTNGNSVVKPAAVNPHQTSPPVSLSTSTSTSAVSIPSLPPAAYQTIFKAQSHSLAKLPPGYDAKAHRTAASQEKSLQCRPLTKTSIKRQRLPFIVNKKPRTLNETDLLHKPTPTLVKAYGRMFNGTLKAIGEAHWGDHECLMELHRRGLGRVMVEDVAWEQWWRDARFQGKMAPAEIIAKCKVLGLESSYERVLEEEEEKNDRLVKRYDSIWDIGKEEGESSELKEGSGDVRDRRGDEVNERAGYTELSRGEKEVRQGRLSTVRTRAGKTIKGERI